VAVVAATRSALITARSKPSRPRRRPSASGSSVAGVTPSHAAYSAADIWIAGATADTAANGRTSRVSSSGSARPTVAGPSSGSRDAAPSPGKRPGAGATPPVRQPSTAARVSVATSRGSSPKPRASAGPPLTARSAEGPRIKRTPTPLSRRAAPRASSRITDGSGAGAPATSGGPRSPSAAGSAAISGRRRPTCRAAPSSARTRRRVCAGET
jgi:hypothetical protein